SGRRGQEDRPTSGLRERRELPSPAHLRRHPTLQCRRALLHRRRGAELLAHDAPARRAVPRDPQIPHPHRGEAGLLPQAHRGRRQGQRRHRRHRHHHQGRQDGRGRLLQRIH
ncbi:hypothetical protein LTR16_012565, partial [Cryomyces antarcticus]